SEVYKRQTGARGDTGAARAYRIASVLELTVLDEGFERPADFDLAAFWQGWSRRYEESVYRAEATVRMTTAALDLMPFVFPPAMARAAREAAGPVDNTGWLHTVVPIESVRHGHIELLKLGADAEVLAPAELRAAFVATARALARRYGAVPDRAVPDSPVRVAARPGDPPGRAATTMSEVRT
ncbi:WYL domain-containing protein, partial [Plantactinospora sp. S1510]